MRKCVRTDAYCVHAYVHFLFCLWSLASFFSGLRLRPGRLNGHFPITEEEVASERGQWKYSRCRSAQPSVVIGNRSIHGEKVGWDLDQPSPSGLTLDKYLLCDPKSLNYLQAADSLHAKACERNRHEHRFQKPDLKIHSMRVNTVLQ